MGQTISRRLASRLDKGMQRYRQLMEEDALKDIQSRKQAGQKYSDPSAVHGGFQRGEGPQELWKDMEQQAFMEQHYHGKATEKEMPEDLIKFLNDVGPLQRKVDKEFTSPRLRQKLDAQQQDLVEDQDAHRQQRDMPIMEQSEFSTTRTTNFSTDTEPTKDEGGLTDQEMYNLLMSSPQDSIEESFVENESDEKERVKKLDLIRHTMNFLAVPVLMKETNDTIIGTWKDRVPELEKIYKLKPVSEDKVRLYMADDQEDDKDKT